MISEPNLKFLHAVEKEDFLPKINFQLTWGELILVGTVGVAVTLAATTKYNAVVQTNAIILPVGGIRIAEAESTGTISRVLVSQNQAEKQGEAIAYLDDDRLQSQKSQLEQNIRQNQQQIAEVDQQIDSLNNKRLAESQLMDRAIASAQAEQIHQQHEHEEKTNTAIAKLQEADVALALSTEELERYQELVDTGAVAQLLVVQKQQAFQAAQAKVQQAKATLNPSLGLVNIATEKIAQEQARKDSILAELDREAEKLQNRKIEAQKQQQSDRASLEQLELELNKTTIRAPVDGIILDLNKTTIRAPVDGIILDLNIRNRDRVVESGETIAKISPSDSTSIVEAAVPAKDISKISVCETPNISQCDRGKVKLRVTAYPYPDYGVLNGAVRSISADVITPDNSVTDNSIFKLNSTTPYYEVAIAPEQFYFERGQKQYPLQAGMAATAEIISREETFLTFFLRQARLLAGF